MKRKGLLIILILAHFSLVFGGGWTCYRFKIEIETDLSKFVGFVEFGDDYRSYLDNNMINYLRESYKHQSDTLIIYDTIYSLTYPTFKHYKLTAILNENIKRIPIDKIKNIDVLEITPCQDWVIERDSSNHEYYFAWVGSTMLVSELTAREIKLLNTEPIYQSSFSIPLLEYSGIQLVSYSNSLLQGDIDKIAHDFKESNISNYNDFRTKYHELKTRLRANDIIIITIDYIP